MISRVRMRNALTGTAAVGLIVLAMALLGLVPFVDLASGAASRPWPCAEVPGVPVPYEGRRHLAYDGEPHEPYGTVPPTSGPHSSRILSPGVYEEPVAEELQVHFLEHGHVLVQYAPATPAGEVAVLERLARRYPRDIAVAPYPALDRGVAVTAWQRVLRADRADEPDVRRFVERARGRYVHGWRTADCLA